MKYYFVDNLKCDGYIVLNFYFRMKIIKNQLRLTSLRQ